MNKQSELLDRLPPHDLEAERAVLGAVMLKSAVLDRLVGIIDAADFYADAHQKLYTHLINLPSTNGEAIDTVVLVNWLKQSGDLEAIGGVAYLGEVAQSVGIAANVVYYAEIVRDHAIRRRLIHAATDTLRDSYSPAATTANIIEAQRTTIDATDSLTSSAWPQWTCRELMAGTFDIRYLIEGVLVEGQPAILAGPKKSLKTSLLLDMAVALANGGSFLGYFQVPVAATVGVMSGESGLATIQETLRRICDTAHCDPTAVTNLIITDRIPAIDQAGDLSTLRGFIRNNHLGVLILDPTYMAMSGEDAGNLFKQGAQLNRLNRLCQEASCTLLLAHHTVKRPGGGLRDPFAPIELEDITWAGFQEYARQWVLVNRRERYEIGTGHHVLWLSVGGSAGHGGLWALTIDEATPTTPGGRIWQVTLDTATDAIEAKDEAKEDQKRKKDEAKHAEYEAAIIATIAHLKHPESKTGIRDLCPIGHRPFDRAWASLIQQDVIVSIGTTRKGTRTVEAYTLSDGESTTTGEP